MTVTGLARGGDAIRPMGHVPPRKTDLVLYDAARRALAEARSVDEVKNVIDHAARLRLYARQARDRSLEADALEIRMRAERRIGELMVAQRETTGLSRGGHAGLFKNPASDAPATLAEAGIDKNLANRARRLARPSEEDFDEIVERAREDIIAEGARVMRRAANAVGKTAKAARPAIVQPGRYNVIVVDPPWPVDQVEYDPRQDDFGLDYPTMSVDEIREFDVASLAAGDCHLFCWTTQRFLPAAFEVVEAWGFRYACTMVWHKPGGYQPMGMPQYNAEFVLYCRRGSARLVDTEGFATCFQAPRREHSRKPDEFYDVVRRVTDGTRIDVFSRERRDGFAQLGNETGAFD